jgi:hypothetical protein
LVDEARVVPSDAENRSIFADLRDVLDLNGRNVGIARIENASLPRESIGRFTST